MNIAESVAKEPILKEEKPRTELRIMCFVGVVSFFSTVSSPWSYFRRIAASSHIRRCITHLAVFVACW